MWQIPFGNTRMRAMNNTNHHYQDNRVEWLLDEPARTHLTEYVNAGVIGFMFGGGNGEVTCACDAADDGTTNPAPINGNNTLSYSADDDGGFFHNRAAAYYTTGVMGLPADRQPPTPTPPTPTPGTPTPPHTAPPTGCVQPTPAGSGVHDAAGGGLQVNVTATGQHNRVLAIEVDRTNNALVDIGGQVGRTGTFSVSLPGTSASTSFTIRRQSSGAVTVNLAVVDRCGRWTTFVGGGPNAF